MRGEQGAIEAEGARLAFVGSGNTAQARDFERRHARGNAIFTDPSAYTYRAIGARSGLVSTLGGQVVHGLRAMRAGHLQTSIEGRPFQHGGVLITLPGDIAAYAYISRMAGDHPASSEVTAALRTAVRAWTPDPVLRPISPAPPPQQAPPPSLPAPAAPSMPPWPGATSPPRPPRMPRFTFELPPDQERRAAG